MRRRFRPPTTSELGFVSLGLVSALVATGTVLAFEYSADPSSAHASVQDISRGALRILRSLHSWAASLLVALLIAHAIRAWILADGILDYAKRWSLGVLALGSTVGLLLLGTILPWDQRGWEAYQHLAAGASFVGVHLDQSDPAAAPLKPIFILHIVVVPTILVVILFLHLRRRAGLRMKQRVSTLASSSRRLLIAASGVLLIAALAAPPFHGPAPVAELQVSRPAWPFLWLVPLQNWWGPAAVWALPVALALMVGSAVVATKVPARARILVAAAAVAVCLALTLVGLRD